jgi:hypothetical protein
LLEKCWFDVSFVFFALEFSGHFVFEWFWMHIQRRYIGLRVLKLWPWPWIQNSPTLSGVPVSTDKHGGGYIHRYTLKLVGGLEHFFFHNIWDNPSHWLSYFSEGLQPPTRKDDCYSYWWFYLPMYVWHSIFGGSGGFESTELHAEDQLHKTLSQHWPPAHQHCRYLRSRWVTD